RGVRIAAACLIAVTTFLGVTRLPAAHAGFCSATSCTLSLDKSDYAPGTGNFGSVKLTLIGNKVIVDVNLSSGLRIVKNGYGSLGFSDDLGGGLTIGDYKSRNSPATKEAIEPPAPLRPFLTNSLISWNRTMNNFNWVGQGYPNNGDGASDSTNASSFQE